MSAASRKARRPCPGMLAWSPQPAIGAFPVAGVSPELRRPRAMPDRLNRDHPKWNSIRLIHRYPAGSESLAGPRSRAGQPPGLGKRRAIASRCPVVRSRVGQKRRGSGRRAPPRPDGRSLWAEKPQGGLNPACRRALRSPGPLFEVQCRFTGSQPRTLANTLTDVGPYSYFGRDFDPILL
jgi:hypothetical protein